jgi:hypothetical protein
MKIEDFALERWLTRHELNVKYDIAESGILPLKLNDLLAFESPDGRTAVLERLLNLPLGYENYLRIGIGQNPSTFKLGLEAASRCFLDMTR